MAHILLSESDEWQLVHEGQDLRGQDLLDPNGLRIGQISDMVIDTAEERVDEVILADGTRYDAADLDIEDGVAYLRGSATEARTPYPNEGVQRVETTPVVDSIDESVYDRDTISGTDTIALGTSGTISGAEAGDYVRHCATLPRDEHDEVFEEHYRQTYQGSGNPYDFYRPAYRFGSDLSRGQGFLNTSFEDVEPSVQDRFASAFPGLRYDTLAGAVRHGFERRRS